MPKDESTTELAQLEKAEDALLTLFLDEVDARGGDFFAHIGLPRDASWGAFRRHYDRNGLPDIQRASVDLASYTPVAAHLAARGLAVLTRGYGASTGRVAPGILCRFHSRRTLSSCSLKTMAFQR